MQFAVWPDALSFVTTAETLRNDTVAWPLLSGLGCGHSGDGLHLAGGVCISCPELCNTFPATRWLKAIDIYLFPVFQAGSLPSGWESHVLSEGSSDSGPFRISAIACRSRHPLACRCVTNLCLHCHMTFLCLCCLFSFYKETSLPCSSVTPSETGSL